MSGGVKFQFPIQIIKSFGINVLHSGKQDDELRAAIALLETAQKSGLSLSELLLLIRGNVRERLLIMKNYHTYPIMIESVESLLNDLTPKPQEQKGASK